MAHPIELGLVLEGEDAKEFLEDLRNPKATKEQIEMFKEAIKLYKEHPFESAQSHGHASTLTHPREGDRLLSSAVRNSS